MSTTAQFDLVIVGGGVAGWSAAVRARQLGLTTLVLERSAEGPSGGNGMLSGGIFHAAYLDPHRPPADLYAEIMAKTDGHARPDVARAWADNVGRALDHLRAAGGRFAPFGPAEFQRHAVAPAVGVDAARHSPVNGLASGTPGLLAHLAEGVVAAGGELRLGRRAVELVVRDGRVSGVVAVLPDGSTETVAAGAVLLCDGGFQGSPALVAEHITSTYALRGSALDTGDALAMGVAVGARTVELQAFYGFVLCRDAVTDERFLRLRLPGPQPFQLIDAAMLVDGHGRRIADEDAGTAPYAYVDEPLAGAIARSSTPGSCWVVFDHHVWETAGRAGRPDGHTVPMNPSYVDAGGALAVADTVAELAEATGLPPAALGDTVAGFNDRCLTGAPVDPPRSGSPTPLTTPPFYAVPVVAGIIYAMGGLLVDGGARVLDGRDRPIPGLLAAGGSMGGLQGGPRNGYAGGWSEAATFGLLAAETAAGVPDAEAATTTAAASTAAEAGRTP